MVNLMRKLKNNKKGFTLIEMIIVIAIIAILAAVLINRYGAFTDRARGQSVLIEAKNVATAIDAMFVENGTYPTEVNDILKRAGVDTVSGAALTLLTNGGFQYTSDVAGVHPDPVAQRANGASANAANTNPVKLN